MPTTPESSSPAIVCVRASHVSYTLWIQIADWPIILPERAAFLAILASSAGVLPVSMQEGPAIFQFAKERRRFAVARLFRGGAFLTIDGKSSPLKRRATMTERCNHGNSRLE